MEGPPQFDQQICRSIVEVKLGDEVKLFCPCSARNATAEVQLEWFKWDNDTDTNEGTDRDAKEDEGVGNWRPVLELGENGTTYTLLPPELQM